MVAAPDVAVSVVGGGSGSSVVAVSAQDVRRAVHEVLQGRGAGSLTALASAPVLRLPAAGVDVVSPHSGQQYEGRGSSPAARGGSVSGAFADFGAVADAMLRRSRL